jgi:cytochrome b561
MKQQATRYHLLLIALHWLLAFLIIAALALGATKLAPMQNSNPEKIDGIRVHMIGGMFILALVLVRLLARNVTVHPAKATTGNLFLDKVAWISHRLLYIAIITMPLMGLALAYQSGLFSIVFAHQGALPPDLWVYWTRTGHYLISRLLMFLIALHICGALYHTFILRDGLLRRMWFGKRKISGK